MSIWNNGHFSEYAWSSAAAFLASFVRAARWYDGTMPGHWWGKIRWSALLVEIPTSITLGIIAVGVGTYYKMDPTVTGAIAGLGGLLGATSVSMVVTQRLQKWSGKDA